MQVFLIEEASKTSLLKRLVKKVELINDKILINCKITKYSQKIRAFKKIQEILAQNNVKNIILSKKLKNDKDLVNLFYSNNFNIIDGKNLHKKLIIQIIENICKANEIKSQDKQISIAINVVNSFGINCTKILARKFKTLNVVTNNINYFKPLKEKLWDEDGIIITLTNNKKKALSKSNIILNVDFSEEVINRYIIFDEAILINLEEEIKIRKKRFCGKIINDYKIKPKENSELEAFLKKEEYENFDIKDLTEVYVTNNPKELENIIIL